MRRTDQHDPEADLAAEIPDKEPTEFVAGDSWRWNKSLSDYPASDGWQLSYAFRGEDDLAVAWSSQVTASGDEFQVRIPAASTTLGPGPYRLYGYVTDGTDRFTVVNGIAVNVLANPATAINQKSRNVVILEAIEAAMDGRLLTPEQKRTKVNGREIEYYDPGQLEKLHATYLLKVEIERNPSGRIEHQVEFV